MTIIIYFLFLPLFFKSYSKVFKVNVNYRGVAIDNAEVSIKSIDKNKELLSSRTIDGSSVFDTSSEKIIVKVKAEGFANKGFIGNIKDKNYINIELTPIYGSFGGRVIYKDKKLEGQEVYLKNLFTEELFKEVTNKNGVFMFNQIPIKQDHFLVIIPDKEGLDIHYEEVFLNDSPDIFQEIILYRKDRLIKLKSNEAGYAVVNGELVELDGNGIGQIFIGSDDLEIAYKGKVKTYKLEKKEEYNTSDISSFVSKLISKNKSSSSRESNFFYLD